MLGPSEGPVRRSAGGAFALPSVDGELLGVLSAGRFDAASASCASGSTTVVPIRSPMRAGGATSGGVGATSAGVVDSGPAGRCSSAVSLAVAASPAAIVAVAFLSMAIVAMASAGAYYHQVLGQPQLQLVA